MLNIRHAIIIMISNPKTKSETNKNTPFRLSVLPPSRLNKRKRKYDT